MSNYYRELALEEHGRECDHCGSEKSIEVHHRDGDKKNNDLDNLLPLCRDCHKQLHISGLDGLEEELPPEMRERTHGNTNTGGSKGFDREYDADELVALCEMHDGLATVEIAEKMDAHYETTRFRCKRLMKEGRLTSMIFGNGRNQERVWYADE